MKETQIISAFPGTGKSFYCDIEYMPGGYAIDSDSSKFNKENFPSNYIEHIESNIGKVAKIFVSSHKDVRDALVAKGLAFTLVYPKKELKDEYLNRYKKRGNTQAFVDLLEKNWDSWHEELEKQKGCNHIQLGEGQFISNVL